MRLQSNFNSNSIIYTGSGEIKTMSEKRVNSNKKVKQPNEDDHTNQNQSFFNQSYKVSFDSFFFSFSCDAVYTIVQKNRWQSAIQKDPRR